MARRKRFSTTDTIIEEQLDQHGLVLEGLIDSDLLVFCSPIEAGIDDLLRDCIEHRCGGRSSRKQKLGVILETPGGYIEVTQRIVHTLRSHYRQVDFYVPNFAMSAGTVLALSGDNIFMDYYSVLGPIDPQVKINGKWLPALGYLEMFKRMIDKSAKGALTTAETIWFTDSFDPAELYSYEQAKELSITLLKEWLAKYKFKGWLKTKSRGRKVTQKMRVERAKEIANKLNDTGLWHSHGHGISMDVLKRRVGLRIEDFSANAEINDAIRAYYRLLKDYMNRTGQAGVIHVRGKYVPVFFRE